MAFHVTTIVTKCPHFNIPSSSITKHLFFTSSYHNPTSSKRVTSNKSSSFTTRCTFFDRSVSKESQTRHDIPSKAYVPSILLPAIKPLESIFATILVFVQITSPLPFVGWDYLSISPANAVLYSPDTKVPRTGELALRKAIPANPNMKAMQDISYLLRIPQRKPYGTMESNVKKALKIAVDEKESILASVPSDVKERGSSLYSSLVDEKRGLPGLLKYIKDKDPDKVSLGLTSSLDTIAELELLQAPGLSFLLPNQYSTYPRLTGRSTVEFTFEKGDGSSFTPVAGGEAMKTATLRVVLDGYSVPLTSGNFVKLVNDGAYNGSKLRCTDQAVISDSTTDKTSSNGMPLEIMPAGQFEPLYRSTLSIQAGLGGLSFDEGQFSVFGYTTVGRDVLPQIKTGDVIVSAKLVDGQDRFILPDGTFEFATTSYYKENIFLTRFAIETRLMCGGCNRVVSCRS